jgi:hypothetical protein
MKQAVQQVIRKQTPMRTKRHSGSNTKRFGSVSYRGFTNYSHDKWERQADSASMRILRGETNVGGMLGSVVAAGVTVAGSYGEPLPKAIKREFEKGFNTDLSPVRIHRDAAAGVAARQEGAAAFSAGRHIYFSPGRFQSYTQAGRSLLAHELAHVFQQTARSGSGGIYRLTGAESAGATIQCQPEKEKMTLKKLATLPQDEIFVHIRKVHEDKHPSLKKWADTWFPEFRKLTDKKKQEKFLKKKIKNTSDKKELGLLLDICRVSAPKLSAEAIKQNFYAQTAFFSPLLFNELRDDPKLGKWWLNLLEKTYLGKLFWSDPFRNAIAEYLMGMPPEKGVKKKYGPITPQDNKATLQGELKYRQALSEDINILADNEAVLGVIVALRDMETYLLNSFKFLDSVPTYKSEIKPGEFKEETLTNHFKRQKAKADIIGTKGQTLSELTGPSDKYKWWWAFRELGKMMFKEGNKVITLLTPVLESLALHASLIANNYSIAGIGEHPLREYLKALPDLPKQLHNGGVTIASGAKEFFQLEPNKKREKRYTDVPQKAETFIELLESQVVNPYVEQGVALYKQSLTQTGIAKEKTVTMARALLWFAGWASGFADFIRTVNEHPGSIDWLIIIRYQTARRLKSIADIFLPSDKVWKTTSDLTAKIFKAGFIQTSELALFHPFDMQKEASLSTIPEDVGERMVGLEPFTPHDVMYFYQSRIIERYNAILKPLVENREKPEVQASADANDVFLIGQADKEMRENIEKRPHRYITYDAYWIKYPSDPDSKFGEVLVAHPLYTELAKKEYAKERVLAYKVNGLNKGSTVVVWSFPEPGELIKPLRGIRLLNAIVYLYKTGSSLFKVTKIEVPKESKEEGKEAKKAEGEPEEIAEEILEVELTDAVIKEAKKHVTIGKKTLSYLSDWDWYLTLTQIKGIAELLTSQSSQIKSDLKKIKKDIRTDLKNSKEAREDLQRRATNLDRQVLGNIDKQSIKNMLAEFNGRTDTFKYLDVVLRILGIFEKSARPAKERELQMSAMMLELAPHFLEQLEGLDFWYYTNRFYTYFSKAVANADQTLAAGDILSGSASKQKKIKEAGVSDLEKLMSIMKKRLTKIQQKFGLQADKGKQFLLSVQHKSFKIKAGNPEFDKDDNKLPDSPDGPFPLEGLNIHIKKVLHTFTFFPRLGTEGPHSLYAPARLYLGQLVEQPKDTGYTLDAAETGEQPVPLVKVVLIFGEESVELIITSKDLNDRRSGLAWLAHVISLRSFVKSLENLAEIIEAYGEGLMFIMSLTPVGWAVDLAYFLGMVAEAFADNPDSIKKQLEALFTEPDEMFEKLLEKIEESLDAEKLLKVFLFAENHYQDLISVKPNKKTVRGTAKRKKSVGNILRGIHNLGTSIAVQVMRLQGKVQNKATAVRAVVLTRPILTAVIQWAAENWDKFDKPEKIILDHPVLGPIYEMVMLIKQKAGAAGIDLSMDDIKEQAASFTDRADSMIKQVTEFELPEEVVPTDLLLGLLVDAFFDFVSKRAPGKIKILTKIINGVAEFLGAKDALAEALAEQMKGTGFDPNTYWKTYFIPELERPLSDALQSLSKELNRLLSQAPIIGEFKQAVIDKPVVEATTSSELNEAFASEDAKKIQPVPETEETASPFPATIVGVNDTGTRLPRISGGRPLSPTLRKSNEQRFGHDFSHVRLHTDDAADKRTRAFGAQALTSGSHIFLCAGITPSSGSGERIMRHELAHVLQKTGPRPLLQKNADTPVVQRGKHGLRWRPTEERAADRMAEKARSDTFNSPVPVIGAHQQGVSPDGVGDVIKSFLDELSDVNVVTEQYAKITETIKDKAKFKKSVSGLDEKVKKHANAIWTAIKYNFDHKQNLDYGGFLKKRNMEKTALHFMITRINDSSKHGPITDAIKLLALNNQTDKSLPLKEKKKAKAKKAGTPTTTKIKELDEFGFIRSLEMYLLGRTGITVTFGKIDYDPEVKKSADKLVKDININAIYLRWIDATPGYSVWDQVLANTWGTPEYKSKMSKLRTEAKRIIDITSGTKDIWDGNEYKFDSDFKREAEKGVYGYKLTADKLPEWPVFSSTKKVGSETVGVHLNTHAVFTKNYPLATIERQSHHTTQFLVAEYFRNVKGFKPFPQDRNWPNTVDVQGGEVNKISKQTGGPAIDVATTYAGNRGGVMPAILLSAKTHLGADLHVTARGDESNTPTQGYSINEIFNKAMPEKMRQDSDPLKHDQYVAGNSAEAGKEIYAAVQTSFKAIRNEMAEKLKNNFPKSEVAYYKAIADTQYEQKIKDVKGTSVENKEKRMVKDLEDIAKQVTKPDSGHNDTEMKKYGWNTKGAK